PPPITTERRKGGTHSRPYRRRRRPDPVEQQRDPPPARHPRPRPRDLRADRPALVDLATPTTAPGPNMPLPPTRPSTTVTTNCRCSIRGSIPLVSTRGNGPSGTARTRPLVQLGVQLEKRLGGPAPLLLGEEVSGSPRRAPSSVAARSTTDGPGTPAPDSHSTRRRSAGNSATSSGPARFATSSPVPHTRACDSPVGTGAPPRSEA